MAKFEISGASYQSQEFDGEVKILVMKRLLPVFTALVMQLPLVAPVIPEVLDLASASEQDDEAGAKLQLFSKFSELLAPVVRQLSAMPDEDVRFILNSCVEVTERRSDVGTGWMKVRVNGVMMNRNDGRYVTLLAIAFNVILDNFADIFAGVGVDIRNLLESVKGA